MKYCSKGQNEICFEAQNVADLAKQQLCGARKKDYDRLLIATLL